MSTISYNIRIMLGILGKFLDSNEREINKLKPLVENINNLEKKVSKYPEKFGTGVIEGVASVEAANNATAQANFIPLMCFGIPTGPSMAIILAAFKHYRSVEADQACELRG